MQPFKTLEYYVSAVDASSARSRWTYILITVASVLAFTAFWNSRHDGWIRNRIRLAQDARTLMLAEYDDRVKLFMGPEKQRFVNALSWLHLSGIVDSARLEVGGPAIQVYGAGTFVSDGNGRMVAKAESRRSDLAVTDALLTAHDLTSRRFEALEMEAFIEDLARMRLETVVFLDVPFLGIHFDINDLGVFAGFAFVVLLVMFRMSQRRELKNLQIAFASAQEAGRHRQMYELLSMYQVFTVPQRYGVKPGGWNLRDHPIRMAWRWIACGPMLLPAVVEGTIVYHDRKTTLFAYTLSPDGLFWSIVLSFAFLIAIVFVTIDCVWLFRAITRKWDEESQRASGPASS